MHDFPRHLATMVAIGTLILFSGCSGKKETADSTPSATAPLDASEQTVISAYYASKPDFFTFATPADLPADLNWQDGHEEQPFADPNAKRGGTINDFMLSWPPTLRIVGPDSNHSMRGVFHDDNDLDLVELHPVTKHWIPSLATAWAVSKDKRTVYYRLDPDARYSDGVPVTADDYFYTFYFMQSPKIQAPWYNNWYGESYTNITKYDDYTISVTLREAKPDPLYYASIPPKPSHFYRVLDDHFVENFQWKFEPTTGPWEVLPRNIVQGNSITLTHVKNWWAENKRFYAHRYNPDRRKFTLIRDANTALESFKKGEIDMFMLNLPEYWYDQTQNLEAVKKGWIRRNVYYNERPCPTIGLYLNRADPLLADKRIRQGIQYACNWQKVSEFIFRGDYSRIKGESDGYGEFDNPDLQPRPFDPARARELFAEAGFTNAGPDGILMRADSTRLSFAITMPQISPYPEEASVLKEEALKAGLELNLDTLDPTTEYKKVMSKQHAIAFSGWSVSLPYPRFWQNSHSINAFDKDGKPLENTNNITSTADPELDAMIDQYRTCTDLDEMVSLAHKIEAFLYDEASYVPGCYRHFYRNGAWAWIRFPAWFDVPISQEPDEYGLYWIDADEKAKVTEAMKNGTDLGAFTGTFGNKPEPTPKN